MSDKKYLSLNGLEQYDALIKAKIAEGDSNSINSSKLYTESYISSEINKLIDGTTIVAEAIFATNASSAIKATKDGNENEISSTYETKTDASVKLTEAKNYTNTVADNKIAAHNTNTTTHNDIRNLISGLTTRLNTLANSDDETLDQMSEIVEYIKSNKSLIDGITTSKVNVADIVNNLTTNVVNKPLSAAQGVAIQSLISALQTELDVHTHDIEDVTGLQSALDDKAASSHGIHVTYSTTAPVMDGNASVGTASTVARSDHIHPTDTSRASQSDFKAHTSNTTIHITATERTKWNEAKTHADSAHAPVNAEANQNAFSNFVVGNVTISADTTADTLTLVAGDNISLTPNADGDSITIAATNDGGDADTLDGYHAEYFAYYSELEELGNYVEELNTKVGDTSVSEQIDGALANFSSGKTLTEHLTEEMMVLTSLQYGDELPDPGIAGRIFFKKVAE